MSDVFPVQDVYGPLIGGEQVKGHGEVLTIANPATGEPIAPCETASVPDVQLAITTAQAAFDSGVWSRAAPADRAAVLSAVARNLAREVPTLAILESEQTGRPLREMRLQLTRLPEWFEYFSALARSEEGTVQPTRGDLLNYVTREPLGVVALITSFNHPMLISVKKLAPALAAGNSVVLKPSELAPLTVLEFAKILKESGVPDGVVSVVPGLGISTGQAIVSDPRIKKVDLTGGTTAGRAIGESVGRNLAYYTAELGGKAPIIVFEDVNLDVAVNGVAFAAFIASGQTCVAGTRIIVQDTIFDAFVEKIRAKADGIYRRMGHPRNPKSMMGPVISARQLSVVETLVDAAKANGVRVIAGGERLTGVSELDGTDFSKGFFYGPTVLADGKTKITANRIWREEAFGPVIVVVPFSSEAEAIALANDSDYGLGSAIWTRNGAQAIRVSKKLETGICWVNTHHRNDPSSSWGGVKASGVGRENGHEAYNAYTATKSVIMSYSTEEEMLKGDDWFREGDAEVRYG